MTQALTDKPTDAESIRTACMHVQTAVVAVEGGEPTPVSMVHLFDEQAFVLIPSASAAADALAEDPDGVTAMIEVTDCAPIEVREPVRALVWLNGVLHPVPGDLERELALEIAAEHPADDLLDLGHGFSLARLVVGGAVIATSAGAAAVDASELARATPDPFWEHEPDWLAHLDSEHSDVVVALTRRLPADLRTGRVRPLGIDRYGIRFRVERSEGDVDTRLSFPRPVGDVMELSRALRALAGCPFPHGS